MFQPALIPSPADGTALPINRIRARAMRAESGAVVGEATSDVSPTAPSWEVVLTIAGSGNGVMVLLYLDLINVSSDGIESVEFSGVGGPLMVSAGALVQPDVPLVRGPLANVYTTGVTIDSAPVTLREGATVTVSATATSSGPSAPTVFWASLAPGVIAVNGTSVTGVVPGIAALVASAGAFSDTTLVTVLTSDTIAPSLLNTVPSSGAVGVARGASVTATFSEALDPGSVTALNFFLRDAAGLPVAGTVSGSGAVATFTPLLPLDSLALYTATLSTGIRDLVGNPLSAAVTWTFRTGSGVALIDTQFAPALGALVAVAFDAVTGGVFLYDDFATVIREYTPGGVEVLPQIPTPGRTSNDYDLDFLPYSTSIGGTAAPANSILVMNGEVAPGVVHAINKDDGAVVDSIVLTVSSPVGVSFHPGRGTCFVVDWTTDIVTEVDLGTGAVVNSFPIAPAGAPAFDMFYGDIEVDDRSGNLILVSSTQNTVRTLTPLGAFVQDVDVGLLGITGMSGVAWDAAAQAAWIVTTTGIVYRVFGVGG